mgnify:CR=1 FL=1
MASLLDAIFVVKGLGFYETVFPFLLVTAVMYGILMKYQVFGDKQIVNILVSMVTGFMFIAFVKTSQFLSFIMPMLTIFLIIFLFLLMTFNFIGVKTEDIARSMTKETSGYLIIIFIVVILSVISIQQVFPEFSYGAFPEVAPDNATFATGLEGRPGAPGASQTAASQLAFQQAIGVMFHPTIVAMVVLFLIMAISVYMITREKL